jgi:hypothetical protein
MVFVNARVNISAGLAKVADRIVEGIGRMNDGSLAIDTAAPSGSNYSRGFRLNSSGAIFGTTATAGTDQWIEGLRVSSLGQLVYEVAASTSFVNGNPLTANGRFAVN